MKHSLILVAAVMLMGGVTSTFAAEVDKECPEGKVLVDGVCKTKRGS